VYCSAGRECNIEVVALSQDDAIEKAYAALEGRRALTLAGALTTLDELGIFEPCALQVRVTSLRADGYIQTAHAEDGTFDLTVQLLSGKSITFVVEPAYNIMWVTPMLDEVFGLQCKTYHLVHNDRLITFHDQSRLTDIGIDGATTLNVIIEEDCPRRVYPWERGRDAHVTP